MPLTIEQAAAAGDLAAAITARQAKIARITAMLDEGWVIDQFSARDLATNASEGLLLDLLDAKTSAQCLQFAVQIYQGQLTALQTALAAI